MFLIIMKYIQIWNTF